MKHQGYSEGQVTNSISILHGLNSMEGATPMI